jgi:hypothetical protein
MAHTAHGVLTAGQVTTVDVEAGRSGGIVVVNRDQAGVIWVRLDGVNPQVEGVDSYAVFGAREFQLGRRQVEQSTSVKLLSDADRAYTVEGF